MALANFLDKAALGVAQILKGFDRAAFEQILSNTSIEICFDNNAASTSEGKSILDLLTRLLARLYPCITFNNIDASNPELKAELEQLALRINPLLSLSAESSSHIYIIVGKTACPKTDGVTLYVGSSNWNAFFSTNHPAGSSDSGNPFGAGAAACIGAANLFREVFKEQLPYGKIDPDFSLSTFSFRKNQDTKCDPQLNAVAANTVLVGLGAIGNGAVWALKRVQGLSGGISLVDHEKVTLSNLQRYVLAEQEDVGRFKTEVISGHLKASRLLIEHDTPMSWNEYLEKRNDFLIDSVAVGVDSARDRIYIQGSLPRKIFNAWTQPEALGISRHVDFINAVCLACLYLPSEKRMSRSEEITLNLGLSVAEYERLIRQYLANGMPVDPTLISLIATAKSIPQGDLIPYLGQHLEVFYSEVVCGGVLMKLSGKGNEAGNLEVPSAFESALAGILLAAEIVIDSSGIQRELPTITRLNLLRPISDYLLENQEKHSSGRCICQDEDYRQVYSSKYSH